MLKYDQFFGVLDCIIQVGSTGKLNLCSVWWLRKYREKKVDRNFKFCGLKY